MKNTCVFSTNLMICFLLSGVSRSELIESRYENGQLKERYYLWHDANNESEINGPYEAWYENGQKKTECNYYAGKQNGLRQEWYRNGQLKLQANFFGNKEHGPWQEWYPNGQLKLQTNFYDGKENGSWQEWHPNGQLKVQTHYFDGKETGQRNCWHTNGRMIEDQDESEGWINRSVNELHHSNVKHRRIR